jgi:NADH:ubiquinone oxidoreductase subunit 6 (subunit J)
MPPVSVLPTPAARPIVLHVAAVVLIAFAFGLGVGTTASLEWPPNPDLVRDVAAAQTARDGHPLADPYYSQEGVWYPPLCPWLVAGLARVSGVPVHRVEARAGAYLNLIAPLGFYWLATLVLPLDAALAALAAFLFLHPFASWQSATYSPWLFTSTVGQGGFYVTLGAWLGYLNAPSVRRASACGASLGVTFLAHSAPALLLALLFTVTTADDLRRRRAGLTHSARSVGLLALAGLASIAIASPFIGSILMRYRGRIRNPLPLIWLDPAMSPDRVGHFVAHASGPWLLTAFIVAGFIAICIGFGRVRSRLITVSWLILAIALFACTGYVWRLGSSPLVQRIAFVPAHHFLIYVRAVEMLFAGAGIALAGRWVAGRLHDRWDLRVTHEAVLVAGLAAGIAIGFPGYLEREDNSDYPRAAASSFIDPAQQQTLEWIASHIRFGEVFLAPENAGLSMIGPLGGKVIVVNRFFSNPYVDWNRRDLAQKRMWQALASGNCDAFSAEAAPYEVAGVMAIDGLTPIVRDGTCRLQMVFNAPPYHMLRWAAAPDR